MPLVARRKDNLAILYRSVPDFQPGYGIRNASLIHGVPENEIEEAVVSSAEWDDHVSNLAERKKMQAIIDNLPRWDLVQKAINDIGSMADAKAVLLKMARVLYWLAKNSET